MEKKNYSDKVNVLDVAMSLANFDKIMREMERAIGVGERSYISITNTESAYYARRIASHRDYINNARFSCCDGVGVVLAGKLVGQQIPRLHGPDLMLKCCEYGVSRNWRHFFYGGREGVPDQLSMRLTEKFPGLITAGAYSPPFRQMTQDEDAATIKRINDSKPDILWVGLGLLKQEQWIAEHLNKINASWMIGVGAAFDFYAGTTRRAPEVFQKVGLEWLYRLAFEPRMLVRNFRSILLLKDVVVASLRHQR